MPDCNHVREFPQKLDELVDELDQVQAASFDGFLHLNKCFLSIHFCRPGPNVFALHRRGANNLAFTSSQLETWPGCAWYSERRFSMSAVKVGSSPPASWPMTACQSSPASCSFSSSGRSRRPGYCSAIINQSGTWLLAFQGQEKAAQTQQPVEKSGARPSWLWVSDRDPDFLRYRPGKNYETHRRDACAPVFQQARRPFRLAWMPWGKPSGSPGDSQQCQGGLFLAKARANEDPAVPETARRAHFRCWNRGTFAFTYSFARRIWAGT